MARFLLDEMIDPDVIDQAPAPGLDMAAIARSPWEGIDDASVLRLAREQQRIVVTYNARHFAPLLAKALAEGNPPPGIVFIHSSAIASRDRAGLARALRRLSGQIDRGEVDPSGGVFLRR